MGVTASFPTPFTVEVREVIDGPPDDFGVPTTVVGVQRRPEHQDDHLAGDVDDSDLIHLCVANAGGVSGKGGTTYGGTTHIDVNPD
ncbi:MAG TPA: hypothetical protein PLC22_03735 [Gordonia sp. (in: high G+C Gram-positive bacteria)]|nr:hypothetical protein [Gordonia sp. (in: high G+C Gram-positive bacteria)]